MATLRRLPVGVQDFEKLRKDGCVYVDKTELIYNLISAGCYYFLSRPRRFGKSSYPLSIPFVWVVMGLVIFVATARTILSKKVKIERSKSVQRIISEAEEILDDYTIIDYDTPKGI